MQKIPNFESLLRKHCYKYRYDNAKSLFFLSLMAVMIINMSPPLQSLHWNHALTSIFFICKIWPQWVLFWQCTVKNNYFAVDVPVSAKSEEHFFFCNVFTHYKHAIAVMIKLCPFVLQFLWKLEKFIDSAPVMKSI